MKVNGNTQSDSQSDRNRPKRGGTTHVTRRLFQNKQYRRVKACDKCVKKFVGGASPDRPNGESDSAMGYKGSLWFTSCLTNSLCLRTPKANSDSEIVHKKKVIIQLKDNYWEMFLKMLCCEVNCWQQRF